MFPMTQTKPASPKTSDYKPPVVAVLGHVDHGKTSLLDFIRHSRIAAGEQGSITQHIGAYQVSVNDGKSITFIDTPGHEAFTSLRSRGARAADIALLVIDAAESVKDQTVESIKIIKAAGVPYIVVLNKIDLPTAKPDKVLRDLLRYDVLTEAHGGKIASVSLSATTGKGVSDLLETIVLVAELKKITEPQIGPLDGVVIEARKDVGRGNVATVLVQRGAVQVGDDVFIDSRQFRVRALIDDRGKNINQAGAGMPVEMLGFEEIPTVGARIRHQKEPNQETVSSLPASHKQVSKEEAILSIFLKADTQGSLEAVVEGLPKEVAVVASGIGDVTEKDVAFAKTAGIAILGFNVRIPSRVKKFAQDEGVRMRIYTIIYKLFEEIADVVEVLSNGPQKNILGSAKIIQEFSYEGARIAGCQIMEGRIARGDKAQVVRGTEELGEPVRVVSIRQQKDEVNKVEKGKMCGIRLSREIDFRPGDMIQSFTLYEI